MVSVDGPTATIEQVLDIDTASGERASGSPVAQARQGRGKIVFDLRNALAQSSEMNIEMSIGSGERSAMEWVMAMEMRIRPVPAPEENAEEAQRDKR